MTNWTPLFLLIVSVFLNIISAFFINYLSKEIEGFKQREKIYIKTIEKLKEKKK